MGKRIDYGAMKAMRDTGMTHAAIAAALGCHVTSVEKAVARLGLAARQPGPPRTRLDVPLLHRLWADGVRAEDIARQIGCSTAHVYALKDRLKLPKRPKPKPVGGNADPTPDEIEQRARECRERHLAAMRDETHETCLAWRRRQGMTA